MTSKVVKYRSQQQSLLPTQTLKKATELYGLSFDNKLDQLLGAGLKVNTLTYLYGKNISRLLNILALNSVRYFGGRALFVDAGNSADPYLIRREADLRKKDLTVTRKILSSIELTRVFTCYQLANFVTEQLPLLLVENSRNENPIKLVAVSGFDYVFSEEDSSNREISNLQCLISQKLSDLSTDKHNSVMFVVVSSEKQCTYLMNYSDIVIEFYHNKRIRGDKAVLMRPYSRLGVELEL